MDKIVSSIYDFVWSPALIVLLLLAGLYFTIRTRFVQVRRLGTMVRLLKPKKTEKGVSSFEALCLALSGCIGTGNIVGVAMAIGIGGPGAVFWMWVIAILGASSAFVESTLAQLFKRPYGNNEYRGGAPFYIEKGLKCGPLAVIFAVITMIACGIFLATVQSNGVSNAALNAFSVPQWVSGVVLALLLGLVLMGGAKRIYKVASFVTPFMALGYLVMALIVLAFNVKAIPSMFSLIFTNAFGINPVCGGILGATVSWGVKRGLFSNEAGQGTGPFVSASAEVKHPAEQGLAHACSVLIDTLVICTGTALMILSTGNYNISDGSGNILLCNNPDLGTNYVGYTQAAIDSVFGGFGGAFVSISLVFFVFTTLMAYYYYSESSLIYLFSRKRKTQSRSEKICKGILQVLMVGAVIFGAIKETALVWTLGDIGVGLMAWINVVVIIILSPKAIKALRDFEKK